MMKSMWNVLPIILFVGLLTGSEENITELSTVKVAQQETSFGDVAADALGRAAKVNIALVPAVAFKQGTIPAAGPTAEQIASLLQTPEESWAVSRLTGAQLRAALERSLSRLPLPNTAFLQVAGLKVRYDPQAQRGSRITSLMTKDRAVNDAQNYEVVMPLSLAKGRSGYFQIFDEDNIVRQGNTGLAQVIVDYLRTTATKKYTGKGRIEVGTSL